MWAPAPSKFTYQWKADGKAISKATGSTFKLTSAQRNKKITVTVTASKTAYTSKTMTSRATGKVAPQPPKYQTPAGLRNINYDGVPGFGGCGFNLTPGMNGLKVQMVADKLGVRQGFQSMSPLLRSRVKRFQASRRIPATGVVDKRTWTAMGFSAASWTGIDCYKRGLRINRDSTRAQIINAFVATSMEYRGRRYIWGGANTPSQGADCSGMIIQALYSIGINPNPNNTVNHALPAWRSSRNMYALSGLRHVPISKVQRGDIVFYAMGGRAINHVAVYIGNGQIIEELPGGGRISGLRSHRGLQAQAVRPVP
jgi:cell wall-associated NlpC family hydrolase